MDDGTRRPRAFAFGSSSGHVRSIVRVRADVYQRPPFGAATPRWFSSFAVPSTVLRTVVISAVAVAPQPVVAWIVAADRLPIDPSAYSQTELATESALWSLAAVAIATYASQVIYGLPSTVPVTLEMMCAHGAAVVGGNLARKGFGAVACRVRVLRGAVADAGRRLRP